MLKKRLWQFPWPFWVHLKSDVGNFHGHFEYLSKYDVENFHGHFVNMGLLRFTKPYFFQEYRQLLWLVTLKFNSREKNWKIQTFLPIPFCKKYKVLQEKFHVKATLPKTANSDIDFHCFCHGGFDENLAIKEPILILCESMSYYRLVKV